MPRKENLLQVNRGGLADEWPRRIDPPAEIVRHATSTPMAACDGLEANRGSRRSVRSSHRPIAPSMVRTQEHPSFQDSRISAGRSIGRRLIVL